MNKEVLYVLLPDYAAHEMVYLSEAIASDEFALKENPKYVNKVVAPTLEPVKSIGGFRVIPDYSFDTMPEDYAGCMLPSLPVEIPRRCVSVMRGWVSKMSIWLLR